MKDMELKLIKRNLNKVWCKIPVNILELNKVWWKKKPVNSWLAIESEVLECSECGSPDGLDVSFSTEGSVRVYSIARPDGDGVFPEAFMEVVDGTG